MSCVPRHETLNMEKLQVITRKGTNIGGDKPASLEYKETKITILIHQSKKNFLTVIQKYFKTFLIEKLLHNPEIKH